MKKKFIAIFLAALFVFCSFSAISAFAAASPEYDVTSMQSALQGKTIGSHTVGVFGSATNEWGIKFLAYDWSEDKYYVIAGRNDAGVSSSTGSALISMVDNSTWSARSGWYNGQGVSAFVITPEQLDGSSSSPIVENWSADISSGAFELIYNAPYGSWCKRSSKDTVDAFFLRLVKTFRQVRISTKQLSGLLNELTSLLPLLIPILIAYIALRKGLKFVLGELRVQ